MDTLHAKATEGGWDLIQVNADELAAGCGDGTFEKLDWSAIGGKDHYVSMAVNDCGIGMILHNIVARLGSRQVSGDAHMGRLLGRGENPRQAGAGEKRARRVGVRVAGRWRGDRRCL